MQCSNNLKQIAISCHMMHDAVNHFPSLCIQKDYATYDTSKFHWRVGWAAMLFPYIEQTARYDLIMKIPDQGLPIAPYTTTATVDYNGNTYTNPYANIITAFLCPSDQVNTTVNGSLAPTSYRINLGDETYNNSISIGTGSLRRGIAGRGDQWVCDMSGITDGTSNTALFIESTIATTHNGTLQTLREGVAQTTADVYRMPISLVEECRSYRDGSKLSSVYPGSRRGTRIADGYGPIFTGVHMVLPPNSPTCTYNNAEFAFCAASSYHAGGAQVALCDGSVRFVSDTINSKRSDYDSLGTGTLTVNNSGESYFGIWGALGTRNGGEKTSF